MKQMPDSFASADEMAAWLKQNQAFQAIIRDKDGTRTRRIADAACKRRLSRRELSLMTDSMWKMAIYYTLIRETQRDSRTLSDEAILCLMDEIAAQRKS